MRVKRFRSTAYDQHDGVAAPWPATEQVIDAAPRRRNSPAAHEEFPVERHDELASESRQVESDARKEPGHVRPFRGEVAESARTQDAVRMRPNDVIVSRIEILLLDQVDGKVGCVVFPYGPFSYPVPSVLV